MSVLLQTTNPKKVQLSKFKLTKDLGIIFISKDETLRFLSATALLLPLSTMKSTSLSRFNGSLKGPAGKQYPFEMDMIIPYGAKFRVENIMKINLFVTMIALSEIDFVSNDDFDLTLDEDDNNNSMHIGASKVSSSPPISPTTYDKKELTSPLRSKKEMADEINGKRKHVLKIKPNITSDGWSDQHNQDFKYFFADVRLPLLAIKYAF